MITQAESSRKHYLKNRERRLVENKARKRRNREFVREYKQAHPCVRCGESEPVCLDFHHLDPSLKFGLLTWMANHGLEKIKDEISKCEILCANCHRKEHFMGG